jgi:hypothetical protein
MVKFTDKEKVYAIVKAVVDKHDIKRLLCCMAPPDEYDRESREIVSAIGREGPVTKKGLPRLIRMVFFHAFHIWSYENFPRLQYYKPMAKDLWEQLPDECCRQLSTSTKTPTTST